MSRFSINTCVLSGNVGRDPQINETASGERVARIPLAVNDRKKPDPNKKSEPSWANLVIFGNLVETVEKFVKSGTAITVVARYQSRKYEKDGETKYSNDFIVDQLKFDGGPMDTEGEDEIPTSTAAPKMAAKAKTTPARKGQTITAEMEEDGDDPF